MNKIFKDESTDEWYFPENSYILSETDSHGLIVYANELFCEMAGYKLEELVGEPHSIVRHPDMPRVAFKSLWNDIQQKGFWTGLVKNLRKDRSFYWVHATALRRVHTNGEVTYLSVRRVPKKSEIEAIIPLYRELKEKE